MNTILTLIFTLFIHSPSPTQAASIPHYGREWLTQVKYQLEQEANSPPITEHNPIPTPPEEEEGYTDIEVGSWYESAVHYVLEENIMIGTQPTSFSPHTTATRGQIATVFFSIEKVPYGLYPNIFPDATYQWYQDAANWCAVHGIMFGYSVDDFAGDQPISRQELAIILYQYQNFREKDTSNIENTLLATYDDQSDVVFYAENAMSWCVNHQLLRPEENSIRPKDFATRAEVAFAIHGLMEKMEESAESEDGEGLEEQSEQLSDLESVETTEEPTST